jgi:uncharacterized lipoprotein
MKKLFRHHAAGVAALFALALALAGCESLTNVAPTKRIDYKSVASAPSLELPPDLTTPRYDDRYQVSPRRAPTRAPSPSSCRRRPMPRSCAPATSAGWS